MGTITGMKMAKASSAEIESAVRLANMLGDVDKGYFPWSNDDVEEPMFFDEDDPEHLKLFYERVSAVLEENPGGLMRVVLGFATIMRNDIFDPAADTLELHPRLALAVEQRDNAMATAKATTDMASELDRQRNVLLAAVEMEHGGINHHPECPICAAISDVKGGA